MLVDDDDDDNGSIVIATSKLFAVGIESVKSMLLTEVSGSNESNAKARHLT